MGVVVPLHIVMFITTLLALNISALKVNSVLKPEDEETDQIERCTLHAKKDNESNCMNLKIAFEHSMRHDAAVSIL